MNNFHSRLGIASGRFSGSGARFRNRSSCKRDKLSVMLDLPGICLALATTLSCRHFNVSAVSKNMTLSDFDVIVFIA